MSNKDVTVVLTSCGRHDLLAKTVESFDRFNTYPVADKLIIEDGPKVPPYFSDWLICNTVERVGQIKAIDTAYSLVKTPYIFHLEDDWEFYAPGFIERSMQILEKHPKIITVWLRAEYDTNGHPLKAMPFDFGTDIKLLSRSYKWKGFTFNPGLRRLSDYQLLGSYGSVTRWDSRQPWRSEMEIGLQYHRRGFYAAIFPGEGYVKHIGHGRHVS